MTSFNISTQIALNNAEETAHAVQSLLGATDMCYGLGHKTTALSKAKQAQDKLAVLETEVARAVHVLRKDLEDDS